MSLGDFHPVEGVEQPRSRPYQTKAANTAIQAGEWVIRGTGGDVEYVTVAADGAANTATWVGVAASTDSVTSGADGEVLVYDDPATVFRGKPTTPGNLATTIKLTEVTLDVASSVQKVDENDTTNGALIVQGYDAASETIDVRMSTLNHIDQGTA